MPSSPEPMTSQTFYRRLDELKSKIDSLPEQYRPQLRAAAASAARQQERMERNSARTADIVADMGLVLEHAKFQIAACRGELRELDPQQRVEL